jgi:hypothetical protein
MNQSNRALHLALPLALALPLGLVLAACASPATSDGTGGTPGGAGMTGGGTAGTTGGGTAGASGGGLGGSVVTGGGGRTGGGGISGLGGAQGLGGATGNPDGGARPDLTGRKALFIVSDSGSLDDGDLLIEELLQIRGMTVTLGTLTTPPSTATGYNLMILSSGLGSDSAAAVFKDVPIPTVVFSNGLYQAMGFVASSAGRGSADGPGQVIIGDTSTALSSDLAKGATIGVTNPSLGNTNYTWGIPGGTAIKVAAVAGAPTEFAVFAYEKGAPMAVGTAAGRRVALGWKSSAEKLLTVEAFKLQDGAFSWTAGAP